MGRYFKVYAELFRRREKAVVNKAFKKVSPVTDAIREFFHLEASGGILLVIAGAIALLIANSPFFGAYDHFLNEVRFRIGFDDMQGDFDLELKKSVLLWINDGFMAIFFLLVALEIKRELVNGELSTRARALLPALAAVGGMVVPAAVYFMINSQSPENFPGWAIPAATDIAFALGVLSLLGPRAPVRLKILLMAIAVIDDLGAILVIALFYSGDIHIGPLYFAFFALCGLATLNFHKVCRITPYLLLGVVLWIAVLKSGIHATMAGVITAFFIPYKSPKSGKMPCKDLEHTLHPWVAFGILPLFAFANAGVPFTGMGLHSLVDPVTLGIILGLIVGKQLGIFLTLFIAIKTGLSPMPQGTNWLQLYAVSVLCGIGFTMSLFIGGLAFDNIEMQASIRLGVLVGSMISAIVGYLILYCTQPVKKEPAKEEQEFDATQGSNQSTSETQS